MKHKPPTPLPVELEEGNPHCIVFADGTSADVSYYENGEEAGEQHAAYLVHAANAYPKLVAALKEVHKGEGAYSQDHLLHAQNCIERAKKLAELALADVDEPL
jgi:hypothetical protein